MNHIGTRTLKTKRLILRRLSENDAKAIYEGFVNQESFLYYANKESRTLEEEIASLKGIDDKYSDPEYYNWLITLDGKVIGAINLNTDDYNESVEFNYAIDDRYRDHGYMTEALMAIRDYCLDEMEANRIFGGCEINNNASRRVMEKCGFVFEGIIRSHLKLKDAYHDMYMFSFIRNRDQR